MEAAKNTVNQGMDAVKGATATGEKEANKGVAKDSNASIGTRAEAAKDAAGNKADEAKHSS